MPLYFKINEFPPAGYPAGTLSFVAEELSLPGTSCEEGPAPRLSFFNQGHYDHPDQSNIRVQGWEHLSFKNWRGSLMRKFLLT